MSRHQSQSIDMRQSAVYCVASQRQSPAASVNDHRQSVPAADATTSITGLGSYALLLLLTGGWWHEIQAG